MWKLESKIVIVFGLFSLSNLILLLGRVQPDFIQHGRDDSFGTIGRRMGYTFAVGHKNNSSSVVSAYYPMSSKHNVTNYIDWMSNFFSLQDQLVIFTSRIGLPDVKSAIEKTNLQRKVFFVVMELNETKTANMFNSTIWSYQLEKDPEREIHKTYELYWIWLAKPEFLQLAVELNPFASSFFAWVDIGYFRDSTWLGSKLISNIPRSLRSNQILLLDVNKGRNRVQLRAAATSHTVGGGFIGGFIPAIFRWNRLFYGLIKQSSQDFIGKDQPYMYQTCFLEDCVCLLVRTGRKKFGDRWFFMAPFLILGLNETGASLWVPMKSIQYLS